MTVSIEGVEVRSVAYGDTKKRAQVVCCGYCKSTEEIFPKGNLLPPEAVKGMAVNKGWKWVKTGKHVCPKCIKKFKAVSMSKTKSDDAPREMQPADKRNIFREIDANYDEKNQRYLDNATDQEISKKLGVPRKWVSDIREADFGPSGRNEEMERVASAIGLMAHQAKMAADEALTAAEKAEKVKIECETLRKRLEALEGAVGPQRAA